MPQPPPPPPPTSICDLPIDVVRKIFNICAAEKGGGGGGGGGGEEEEEEKGQADCPPDESIARHAVLFLTIGDRTCRAVAESVLRRTSPRIKSAIMHDRQQSSISMSLAHTLGILPIDVRVRSKKDETGHVHLNMADVVRSMSDLEYDRIERSLNASVCLFRQKSLANKTLAINLAYDVQYL